MFGFGDRELANKSGYDLIHPDDLNYFSAAHGECKYNDGAEYTQLLLFCFDCD